MDAVQELLESTNFATLHGVLTFIGAILCLLTMQLTSWAGLDAADPPWLQWTNRLGKLILALALLWSFNTVNSHGWDPFRPGIAVLFALDFTLFLRTVTLLIAINRQGAHIRRRLEDEGFFNTLHRPGHRARAPRGHSRSWGKH